LRGFAVVASVTVLAAIGDTTRFPSAKKPIGYSGLGLSIHASGQRHHHQRAPALSMPRLIVDPATALDINVVGTQNVLLAAREAGVRRVVLAASSAVCGNGQHLPTSEEQCPDPISPYFAMPSTS
jgi:transposase